MCKSRQEKGPFFIRALKVSARHVKFSSNFQIWENLCSEFKTCRRWLTSGVCLATSRISVAQFFFTYSSESKIGQDGQFEFHKKKQFAIPFRQVRTLGNISASTTISANSTECLLICERAEKTCLFSLASGFKVKLARWAMAPASTTVWANSEG